MAATTRTLTLPDGSTKSVDGWYISDGEMGLAHTVMANAPVGSHYSWGRAGRPVADYVKVSNLVYLVKAAFADKWCEATLTDPLFDYFREMAGERQHFYSRRFSGPEDWTPTRGQQRRDRRAERRLQDGKTSHWSFRKSSSDAVHALRQLGI